MKKWVKNLLPIVFDWRKECWFFGLCNLIGIVGSFGWVIRYVNALQRVHKYNYATGEYYFDGSIPYFHELTSGMFYGFFAVAAVLLLRLLLHYTYHYQGSKSIYLMRRLPDKGLMHRKAITLPIAEAVLTLLIALLIFTIYVLIYRYATPSEALPLDAWRMFA